MKGRLIKVVGGKKDVGAVGTCFWQGFVNNKHGGHGGHMRVGLKNAQGKVVWAAQKDVEIVGEEKPIPAPPPAPPPPPPAPATEPENDWTFIEGRVVSDHLNEGFILFAPLLADIPGISSEEIVLRLETPPARVIGNCGHNGVEVPLWLARKKELVEA